MSGLTHAEAWLSLIGTVSSEQGWQLDRAERVRYCAALRLYLPANAPAALVRRVCVNYHYDYRLVAALREQTQSQASPAWTNWMGLVLRVLERAQSAPSSARAGDARDLALHALQALMYALPHYRFQSRLNTWAHTVVVRTLLELGRQRYLPTEEDHGSYDAPYDP